MNWYKLKKFKHFLFVFSLIMMSLSISAQNRLSVKGVISDTGGEPLLGVSVIEVGTLNGTVSDLNGNFSINVSEGAILRFSFIGFETVELPATADMSVTLSDNVRLLEEFVVVGYGVQKRSLVSGAISKISSQELDRTMPTRLEDLMNGKMAGMQIMQTSGQPGAGSDVFVRGIGTVNNSAPLYVVDGMQIEGNINFLNPKDIESVEVLKDAASAAIYGTRGANGVILVTTKKGVKGKNVVSYDFNYGWQNPWKKREVLNAQEYMTIMNEMAVNDGGKFRYTAEEIRNAKTTDWQEEVFNYNAPVINHNISLSGGGENNTYNITFGYLSQEGIIGGNFGKSNLERYNFRVNTSQIAYNNNTRNYINKLNVGVNVAYTHGENTGIDTNSEYGSILGSALVYAPHYSVYEDIAVLNDPNSWYNQLISKDNPEWGRWIDIAIKDKDGRTFKVPDPADNFKEIGNPVAMLHNKKQYRLNVEDVFVGGVWGELDIWKGIKLRSSYNIDMSFWGNNGYNLPYYIADGGKVLENLDKSNIFAQKNNRFTWQVENYITWTEQFADKHNVMLMAGQSALKTTIGQLGGSRGRPIFDEHDLLLDINNTEEIRNLYNVYGFYSGSGVNFYALASYFGRFNYDYDERYILSASIRRDGSSRFGPDNKWGMFPAVSVAWNILNEPYISNIPAWMSAAKLRLSWGRNGNDRIGDLRYIATYSRGSAYDYYFGGTYNPSTLTWNGELVSGVQPGSLENRLLGWEQSEQLNAGIDLALFRHALNLSFEWYKKTTIGMLQDVILPPSTGQMPPIGNVGDMSNTGIEITLGYKGKAGGFNYYIDGNATYLKTVLDKYGTPDGIQRSIESSGAAGIGEFMRGQTGEIYPFFYGLQTDGIFQNWNEINSYTFTYKDENGNSVTKLIQPNARPGDIRFIDRDKDGSITESDKTYIGKPIPDWIFGITLGGDWKGFDFNIFLKSAVGFQIFDFSQRQDAATFNRPAWVLDRWHGEGTSNTVPRVTASDPNGNFTSSDMNLKKGDYLRLKTAQIGYTLPRNLTEKVSIQKLRVYVAGYNLLTFTGYDGFDVEMGSRSIDKGIYPQARTVTVGVNLTF